jgi:hypothetical protein
MKPLAWIAVLAVSVFVATPASADTYFDGRSYQDSWEGQTSFSATTLNSNGDVETLAGYVNWIVYNAGDFPYAAPGYKTSGELTYVFQLFSTGTDQIHSFKTELDNDADSIGTFAAPAGGLAAAGGMTPSGMVLNSGDSTLWEFMGSSAIGKDAHGQDEHSQLLIFSSSSSPDDVLGNVLDGGGEVYVDPVPGPGSVTITNPVPEPATLSLTLVGLGFMAAAWAVRQRQRKNCG